MADFKKLQIEFTTTIRENLKTNSMGIEPRRLAIYQELMFNNTRSFVDNAFPVLKSLYSEKDWVELERGFFKKHVSTSPLFSDIAKEFIDYITNERELTEQDPIFMRELAHYEWVELDVSIREELKPRKLVTELKTEKMRLSELAQLVSYPYPVHKISRSFRPDASGERHYLVVYRNLSDAVSFLEVNEVNAYLIDLIDKNIACHYSELLNYFITALPQYDKATLEAGLFDNLSQLAGLGIIVSIE